MSPNEAIQPSRHLVPSSAYLESILLPSLSRKLPLELHKPSTGCERCERAAAVRLGYTRDSRLVSRRSCPSSQLRTVCGTATPRGDTLSVQSSLARRKLPSPSPALPTHALNDNIDAPLRPDPLVIKAIPNDQVERLAVLGIREPRLETAVSRRRCFVVLVEITEHATD